MKDTRHIVEIIKATGRRQREQSIVALWKEIVAEWAARTPNDPDAAAVKSWLPKWQSRPFYTAEELAPLWPALAIATGFTSRWPVVPKSAKRLEYELDFCGLPRLARRPEYFIVERLAYWKNASEAEILQELENAQR